MGSYATQKYATESVSFPKSASSAPGQRSYATFSDLPATSTTVGNTAFVVATNKLYMWTGAGWYLIATVTNAQPSSITGINDSYFLAIDGSATTITAVATDPEGFDLTWSYAVTAGSLTVVPAALAVGVANSGASAYTLSGGATGDNANVAIKVGQTVNFTVNASGHPFYIRDSNGGSNVSSPAATGQGAVSGVVSWTPNTTGTYYYQCGNHNAMVGTITVTSADITADVAQAANVFTITPSAVEANAGTFSLTFNVTDGVNGSVSTVSAFTLSFFAFSTAFTKTGSGTAGDRFGMACCTNGTYAAAGASEKPKYAGTSSHNGAVYMYNVSDGTAVSGFNPLSTAPADMYFGGAVAMSDTMLAVSSLPNTTTLNKVNVYNLSSSSVLFTKQSSMASTTDKWGRSIAISGNYLLISDHENSEVEVYATNDFGSHSRGDLIRVWSQGTNVPNGGSDTFGQRIRVHGDVAIISNYTYSNSTGRVHRYSLSTGAEITDGVWPIQGLANSSQLGREIAFDGTHIALAESKNSGGTNDPTCVIINASTNAIVSRISNTQAANVYALALTGSHVFIGDGFHNSQAGLVSIYNIATGAAYTPTGWPLAGSTASDYFGYTFSLLNMRGDMFAQGPGVVVLGSERFAGGATSGRMLIIK